MADTAALKQFIIDSINPDKLGIGVDAAFRLISEDDARKVVVGVKGTKDARLREGRTRVLQSALDELEKEDRISAYVVARQKGRNPMVLVYPPEKEEGEVNIVVKVKEAPRRDPLDAHLYAITFTGLLHGGLEGTLSGHIRLTGEKAFYASPLPENFLSSVAAALSFGMVSGQVEEDEAGWSFVWARKRFNELAKD